MSHSRAFWRLNGSWIIFTGHLLESNTDIYSTICPWNQFKLILQRRLMQFEKKIHTFFLLLRSLILKLNYLYYFGSSISKIRPCSSTPNLLSNSTGVTWFGCFKIKLCPISHNGLIMYWFSRANVYGVPCVTFSSFSSKIDTQETKVCVISVTFYKIPIRCSERELWIFYHDHLFDMKFGSLKKALTSTNHISKNIANQDMKFLQEVPQDFRF